MPRAVVVAAVAVAALCGTAARGEGAPPPSTQAKHKLLVLDVAAPEVGKSQAATLTSLLASRAARFPSLDVMTTADLRDLAKLEADKAEAGCDETNASCLAELAGAMGAELVLTSRAGKLDAEYVVSLQLFDAKTATAVGRESVQAWSLAELPEKIGPALDAMLQKQTGEQPVEVVRPVEKQRPALALDDSLRFPLQVAGGGSALVGAGVFALGVVPALGYSGKKDELRTETNAFTGDPHQIDAAVATRKAALEDKALYNNVGRWAVLGGAVLVVAGGAVLGAAFALPGAE